MTNTRSPRIHWEEYDGRGFKGFTAAQPRNGFGNNHTYWIGPINHGGPIIADVFIHRGHDWENIDVPCATIEEAKAWCEAIEATGAYR
jgi:hypothetical protein